MTRITKDVKEELARSLLLNSPLYAEAKAAVLSRAALVEAIRLECLAQCDASDELISQSVTKAAKVPSYDKFTRAGVHRQEVVKKAALMFVIRGECHYMDVQGDYKMYLSDFGRSMSLSDFNFYGKDLLPPLQSNGFLPIDRVFLTESDYVGDLYDLLCKSNSDLESLFAKHSGFTLQIKSALASISTEKKLVELWPEAVAFLPKKEIPAGTGLAVSVADLNALCGLPK